MEVERDLCHYQANIQTICPDENFGPTKICLIGFTLAPRNKKHISPII